MSGPTLRRAAAPALVAALALLAPSVALAQTEAPAISAEEHYALGSRLFAQRSFGAAAREFQAAYASERRVELLFNIGRALEEDGQLRLALDAYRRFLDAMPADFDRASLRTRVEGIEQRLARQAPAPAPAPARPEPRRPPVAAVAAPSSGPPAGAIALLAGGGAALVTGAVLGFLSHDALDGCRVEGDVARCRDQSALDRATSAPGLATAANVSLLVGAAAVAVGATWWILAPSPRVRVAAGPGSVSLAVRF